MCRDHKTAGFNLFFSSLSSRSYIITAFFSPYFFSLWWKLVELKNMQSEFNSDAEVTHMRCAKRNCNEWKNADGVLSLMIPI